MFFWAKWFDLLFYGTRFAGSGQAPTSTFVDVEEVLDMALPTADTTSKDLRHDNILLG